MESSKKYIINLSFFDINAVFKTETDSWDDAIKILESVDNALYNIQNKTQIGEAYIVSGHIEQNDFEPQNPVETPLYTLQEYGRGYIIRCNNPSKCEFLGKACLSITDSEYGPKAYFNGPIGAWVVRRRDYNDACAFVKKLNGVEEITDNYFLIKYKNAYLIRCRRPNECFFWGSPYLSLDNNGVVSYWNDPLKAWVVKSSDKEVAEHFINISNYPQLRRQTSNGPAQAIPMRRQITPENDSSPHQPRYMTRAACRRLAQKNNGDKN